MISLMIFINNNQEIVQINSSVHNIKEVIRAIFTDQMPTYLVSKKAHSMASSKFATVYRPV